MATKGKSTLRTFAEEFKRDAVNRVAKEGYSFKSVADAANVSENSLRIWYRKLAPLPEPCGSDATVAQLRAENKRLRRQLRQLELEREILKKEMAYFANQSQQNTPGSNKTATHIRSR